MGIPVNAERELQVVIGMYASAVRLREQADELNGQAAQIEREALNRSNALAQHRGVGK